MHGYKQYIAGYRLQTSFTQVVFLFGVPNQNFISISYLSTSCISHCCTGLSNMFDKWYKLWRTSGYNIPLHLLFFSIGSKYSLQHPVCITYTYVKELQKRVISSTVIYVFLCSCISGLSLCLESRNIQRLEITNHMLCYGIWSTYVLVCIWFLQLDGR